MTVGCDLGLRMSKCLKLSRLLTVLSQNKTEFSVRNTSSLNAFLACQLAGVVLMSLGPRAFTYLCLSRSYEILSHCIYEDLENGGI